MVETLNNRLNDERIGFEDLGLIVVDEAHYNSFRKLFKHFDKQVLLGVTATPLSSNIKLPLHDNYLELIVGESIGSLVEQGFLAKANTYSYDVNLRALKVGINGDYTVSSSERLYGNFLMQEKLLYAYEEKAKGPKRSSSTTASTRRNKCRPCSPRKDIPACTSTTRTAKRSAPTFWPGFTTRLTPCSLPCPS